MIAVGLARLESEHDTQADPRKWLAVLFTDPGRQIVK